MWIARDRRPRMPTIGDRRRDMRADGTAFPICRSITGNGVRQNIALECMTVTIATRNGARVWLLRHRRAYLRIRLKQWNGPAQPSDSQDVARKKPSAYSCRRALPCYRRYVLCD